MAYSEILYDKSEQIATITMNRPERLNAWTPTMGRETREAFMEADRDSDVRVIIITGAGKAYCAGADMQVLDRAAQGDRRAVDSGRREHEASGMPSDYQTEFSYPPTISKPVIAAVNGACVGIGFTTCLYHDIRIAAEGARMGLIFVRRGLAIEHGSSWLLPRIIGLSRALEMALTGKLIDAQEALSIGLVNRVTPPNRLLATAREMAREIAAKCAPLGVAEAKRGIYKHLLSDLGAAIREDDEATRRMYDTEDFKEGVQSFVEKRPARFVGR